MLRATKKACTIAGKLYLGFMSINILMMESVVNYGMIAKSVYNSDGWVNAQTFFDDPATFIVVCGGRGIGKTFNVLKYTLDNQIKFVYVRRTQEQINAVKLPVLNPFKKINDVCGYHIGVGSIGKNVAGFYNCVEDKGEYKISGAPVGIGLALSTFASIRGIDGSDYELLLFDEFVPEKHERPIKAEEEAFLNAYETLNRNREFDGQPPLKCILLSNANDLNSAILHAIGARDMLDEMIRKKQQYKNVGALSIYRLIDSPVSERKKKTALYQVAKNKDFRRMSIENEFSESNYENVEVKPINEYKPLVSIGEITVYEHKSDSSYYVVPGIKSKIRFTMLPNDVKSFRRHYWYLYEAILNKSIAYATAPVKIDFESLW